MKNQALFSLKDKSEKLKCRLLQFLFGPLRVNATNTCALGAHTKASQATTLKVRILSVNSSKRNHFSSSLNTLLTSQVKSYLGLGEILLNKPFINLVTLTGF